MHTTYDKYEVLKININGPFSHSWSHNNDILSYYHYTYNSQYIAHYAQVEPTSYNVNKKQYYET